jgi:hypothetical protein
MDVWFMNAYAGRLFGNGKGGNDKAGGFKAGDRIGLLLDLDCGSLLFFKNGENHGPGYGAGSVTGAVVLAMQMENKGSSGKVVAGVVWPCFPTHQNEVSSKIPYEGRIHEERGVVCIASFPGKFEDEWREVVALGSEETVGAVSVACVRPRYQKKKSGQHVKDPATGRCYCKSIYGKRKAW